MNIFYFSELRSNKAVNDKVDGGIEDDKISANKISQPLMVWGKVEGPFPKATQNCWNSEEKNIRN